MQQTMHIPKEKRSRSDLVPEKVFGQVKEAKQQSGQVELDDKLVNDQVTLPNEQVTHVQGTVD